MIKAMDLIDYEHGIGQYGQHADGPVAVLHERQELVDGGREGPLRPETQREHPPFGLVAPPTAGIGLILEHVLEVKRGRAVHQCGIGLRGP